MSHVTIGRVLCAGPVRFTYGRHNGRKGYLQVSCIGSEEQPARIELYESEKKSASKGKPPLCQLLFLNVKNIDLSPDQQISLSFKEGDTLSFAPTSGDSINSMEWLEYCRLLSILPHDVIPEVPKRCLVSPECAKRYTDPGKYGATGIWVVYFINEGVGLKLKFTGLHFVTVRNTNLTFNIYNFHNAKHLLSWDHDKIRRSGRFGPMVFLEIGTRCEGGPGVLWMHCADGVTGKFRESLHKFIHNDSGSVTNVSAQVDPVHVSVDSTLSKTYRSRQHLLEGIPPPLPPKDKTRLHNCSQHSVACSHEPSDSSSSNFTTTMHKPVTRDTLDSSQNEEYEYYRPRALGMSTAQAEEFKSLYCKPKSTSACHSTSTVALHSDQTKCNNGQSCAKSNQDSDSTTPPPLPPKPQCHKYENSQSVYQPNKRTRSPPDESTCTRSVNQTLPKVCNRSKAKLSKHELEEIAFKECSQSFTSKLDVGSIFPHLNSHHLLTVKDQQFLNNPTHEDIDKIYYLLGRLPRKANGWFDKVVKSLKQSADCTGHSDIADSLLQKLEYLKKTDTGCTYASTPVQVSGSDSEAGKEVAFKVFVDSHITDTVRTLQVRSSESVGFLRSKIRQKFDIPSSKPFKVQLEDGPVHHSTQSLQDTKIIRYSYITVTLLSDDEQ